MANRVLVNENSLADIAAAIREKTGNTEASFTPGQMGDAIRAIEQGSTEVIEPVIEALSITVNGVYTAPEGLDGYNPITVEVPSKEPVVESIEIKANGTYTPSTGVDGFNEVVVDVPSSGGGDLPEEAFTITGDCTNRFSYGGWDWFINMYGSKIKTDNIIAGSNMFKSTTVERIPFEINFNNKQAFMADGMFAGANKLKEAPKINNFKPSATQNIFNGCHSLTTFPEDFNDGFDWSVMDTYTSAYNGNRSYPFYGCLSLRKLPMDFLAHGNPKAANSYSIYYYAFGTCYALDEIVNLPVLHREAGWTSNAFNYTFRECGRLKEMTFALQEDGTPYTVNWKNQLIDLSYRVGYVYSHSSIAQYNSGITQDKRVTTAEEYERLKDNPDWFTDNGWYSRYNHDSAVNTINSLPITTGTGCSIKFEGSAGSLTDGGAINTLTEEEIAVAAAKGWTVSLV